MYDIRQDSDFRPVFPVIDAHYITTGPAEVLMVTSNWYLEALH
jgi:hypothetical protein